MESVYPDGSCTFTADDTNEKFEGIYYIYPNKKILSSEIDVALVPIGISISVEGLTAKLKENLNYNISSLPRCSKKMPQGSKVVIIGYPAYAQEEFTIQGLSGVSNARIITEGVISGYSSILPTSNPNYYVSAKVDSGNSGGVALSKDEKGLCFLGIPTWLSLGNYETQGVVQNAWYLLINLMAL